MSGTRIIPGVQVTVVKDPLPQQLSPTGVLGLIGFTEQLPDAGAERAASWNRFIEIFGQASAYSLPEARQALDNGVSELVVVSLPHTSAEKAKPSFGTQSSAGAAWAITARVPGTWANGLRVELRRSGQGICDVRIQRQKNQDSWEVYRNTPLESEAFLATLRSSAILTVSGTPSFPKRTDGSEEDVLLGSLTGGTDASAEDYATALNRLRDESDVDMVLPAIQDFSNLSKVTKIYSDTISHCKGMSADCKGRLGLGQLPPISNLAQEMRSFSDLANSLLSDRFVLVAPHGAVGAVAGMIGSLSFFQSPTFKTLSGLGTLSTRLGFEAQQEMLRSNIVPVVLERGKGLIVVRGLTTDGDQINVRRTADRAVRMMKMIGDLFIGRLNNADGRSALKQKLIESLVQMEKDGALVPSTDGKDPAFKVDVYSSQNDFALGIVRVDMAVRPVRAIDYIYATILVQV